MGKSYVFARAFPKPARGAMALAFAGAAVNAAAVIVNHTYGPGAIGFDAIAGMTAAAGLIAGCGYWIQSVGLVEIETRFSPDDIRDIIARHEGFARRDISLSEVVTRVDTVGKALAAKRTNAGGVDGRGSRVPDSQVHVMSEPITGDGSGNVARLADGIREVQESGAMPRRGNW